MAQPLVVIASQPTRSYFWIFFLDDIETNEGLWPNITWICQSGQQYFAVFPKKETFLWTHLISSVKGTGVLKKPFYMRFLCSMWDSYYSYHPGWLATIPQGFLCGRGTDYQERKTVADRTSRISMCQQHGVVTRYYGSQAVAFLNTKKYEIKIT